ncbi:MAG TPA: ASKHA domain-containing protein, partial [Ottowia sp.]|nr:ASKHA domain-containing protein [Ottowia sp.]
MALGHALLHLRRVEAAAARAHAVTAGALLLGLVAVAALERHGAHGLGEGGGKAEFVLAWPHETSTGSAITVHSDDIRAIQLAKAALYAGVRLLMDK